MVQPQPADYIQVHDLLQLVMKVMAANRSLTSAPSSESKVGVLFKGMSFTSKTF